MWLNTNEFSSHYSKSEISCSFNFFPHLFIHSNIFIDCFNLKLINFYIYFCSFSGFSFKHQSSSLNEFSFFLCSFIYLVRFSSTKRTDFNWQANVFVLHLVLMTQIKRIHSLSTVQLDFSLTESVRGEKHTAKLKCFAFNEQVEQNRKKNYAYFVDECDKTFQFASYSN